MITVADHRAVLENFLEKLESELDDAHEIEPDSELLQSMADRVDDVLAPILGLESGQVGKELPHGVRTRSLSAIQRFEKAGRV